MPGTGDWGWGAGNSRLNTGIKTVKKSFYRGYLDPLCCQELCHCLNIFRVLFCGVELVAGGCRCRIFNLATSAGACAPTKLPVSHGAPSLRFWCIFFVDQRASREIS